MPMILFTPYPELAPSPSPPDDYQRLQSNPGMFGGLVGEAEERGGAQVKEAGDQVFQRANEINADQASYDFQGKAQKLLYGDPDNPDPTQRLGLRQLRGQAALDAYPRVRDQLKQLYDDARTSLGNYPMAQLEFDRSSRRLYYYFGNEAGAHYDQEFQTYSVATQQAGQQVAKQGVLAHPEDEAAVQGFGGDMMRAAIREQQTIHGDNLPPEIYNATEGKVRGEITAARIDGLLAQGKPDLAGQIFDRDKGALAEHDLGRLRPVVDRMAGKADADRLWAGGSPDASGPGSASGANWETQHNNFGGIRKIGVPAAGPNAGGFQSFDTPEAGVQAISHQLDLYAQGSPATGGKPLNTLGQIVSTWAPPNENDTPALIARAAQVTGFAPDQALDLSDPGVKAKLIEATIRNEQGGKLPVDPALIAKVAGAPAVPAAAPPGPTSAAAAFAPQRIDGLVADVQARAANGDISPERAQAAIGELTRKYRQWQQATASDRAALKQSISGGLGILASGRDYDIDEAQIRRLFPADEADKYLTLLDDAKTQGQAMQSVAGSTPEELAQTRARLQADLDLNLNPVDFAKRARYAEAFGHAAEHRLGEFEAQAGQEAVAGLRNAPVPAEAVQGKLGTEDLKEFAGGSPQHAALAAQLGNYPSDVDAQRRQRLLDHFDAAVVQHYRALATDPASYVASWNPDIQTKAETASRASDPEQARQLFAGYAADVLGAQDRLGLHPEQQHVLGVPQARAIVQDLIGNPENAPARFRGMAARFGDYWPKVWQDLATLGKLPGGWQLVGQLADYDSGNAGLLARQLSQQPKDQRESALKERAGIGAKSIEAQLAETVDGDSRLALFDRSLANGFVGETARNEITGAIHSLAKARYLYANEDPATAATKAVDAAIGHYQFDPRSGARAPAPIFDAVSDNARAVLGGLSPARVAVPDAFRVPEQPTTAPGMLTQGNIDLLHRPQVKTPEGTATVRSISINADGREVLIPTVAADGSRILSDPEAIDQYRRTGKMLGVFDTADHATLYAERLHQAQGALLASVGRPTPEDYVAQLKAAPIWVNAPKNDAWWLVDPGGRFVIGSDGNHVAAPFSAARLPPPPPATPFLPSPVSPF